MAIATAVLTAIQNKADFKKESKERIEKYHKYADNKRLEITEYRNEERDTLEQIYTDLPTEQSLFMDFSSDLFDRQIQDDDFLQVRLGLGSIKPSRNIEYKKQERLEVEDDLQLIPEKISDEFSVLANAPVVCNFKDSNSVGIVGNEEYRFSIMKNIIIDICARQYYTDVQLFFVATEEHKDKVRWLRFLHTYQMKQPIHVILFVMMKAKIEFLIFFSRNFLSVSRVKKVSILLCSFMMNVDFKHILFQNLPTS